MLCNIMGSGTGWKVWVGEGATKENLTPISKGFEKKFYCFAKKGGPQPPFGGGPEY